MSKALRTAAIVVGAAAVIVGTAGLAAPAATAAALGSIGVTASAASIAAGLSLAATGLSLAGGLTAKKVKPSDNGIQTRLTANMNQGLPYPMGRTRPAMFIIHRGSAP